MAKTHESKVHKWWLRFQKNSGLGVRLLKKHNLRLGLDKIR